MSLVENFFNRFRDSILNQTIEGEYVKPNLAKRNKKLIVIGILNLLLGTVAFYSYSNITSLKITYKEPLDELIYLDEGIHNIYIQLNGLYQNYLGYTKSISYNQLKGNIVKNLSNTSPFDYRNDLPVYPAGAVAYTYFQDDIKITDLEISTAGIAFESEKKLIKPTNYNANEIVYPETWTIQTNANTKSLNGNTPGIPILNERYANWISLAFFADFKKLWGRVYVPQQGYYRLQVDSKYDQAKEKAIYITSQSHLGIRNYLIAIAIMVIGGVGIISGILVGRYA